VTDVPPTATLSANPASINQSVSSCAASGGTSGDGWTGSMSTHGGQQSITETSGGSYTYTLSCDSGGSPVTATAKVDVSESVATQPPTPSSSGGGALDPLLLFGLLALTERRLRRRRLA